MRHWHFTRTTVDPLSKVADLDLYLCVNQFATVQEATVALFDDVSRCYPAKRDQVALADMRQKMSVHGEMCAYQYKPNPDVLVQWRIRECTGATCADTLRNYEYEIRSIVTRALGPIVDIARSDGGE